MDDVGWRDQLAGHRMAVDREFDQEVRDSALTSGQWGLVMTAVEFEIEEADDPAEAALVANTAKLPHVLPEMKRRAGGQGFPAAGGSGAAGPGDPGQPGTSDSPDDGTIGSPDADPPTAGSDDGFIDRVLQALGVGGEDDEAEALLREADRLAAAYAERLQARLEREEVWESVVVMAKQESSDGPD